MNRNKMKLPLLVMFYFSCTFAVFADEGMSDEQKEENRVYATPFQLSFYAPIQLSPVDSNVYGLRIGVIYGVNNKVYGVDLGLWNKSTGDQFGIQVGALLVSREGRTFGLNIGGLANFSEGNEYGLSIGGLYNQANGKITGVQLAGCVAKAKHVRGLQFSLINYCEDLTGVQIGLLNICTKGSVPFMLLINAKY